MLDGPRQALDGPKRPQKALNDPKPGYRVPFDPTHLIKTCHVINKFLTLVASSKRYLVLLFYNIPILESSKYQASTKAEIIEMRLSVTPKKTKKQISSKVQLVSPKFKHY